MRATTICLLAFVAAAAALPFYFTDVTGVETKRSGLVAPPGSLDGAL